MSEYVRQELLDGWIVAHDKQKARAEAAEAERDAYRKAKQENDERFQLEAMKQRERAEAAERKLARVEALRDMYKRDDEESLDTFGQHHPVAGVAYDHLSAALADEETT